jgi:hypothetical protein
MEQLLKNFIKERTAQDVHLHSILFDDLGISGLDADTFMDDFFEEFSIKRADFEIDKFNVPESRLTTIFSQLLIFLFNRKKSGSCSFTVQHLLDVIERGEWYDPDPN